MATAGCVPAPTLVAALKELDQLHPGRNHGGEGVCGSRANKSDHPVGNAMDVWHDPAHGADGNVLAQLIIGRQDPRVTYVIWNRRIYGPGSRFGWAGGPYNGASPHTDHVHVSIRPEARNDMGAWWGGTPGGAGGIAGGVGGGTQALGGGPLGGVLGGPGDALAALGKLGELLADPTTFKRLFWILVGMVVFTVGALILVIDSRAARGIVKGATGGAVDVGNVGLGDVAPKGAP